MTKFKTDIYLILMLTAWSSAHLACDETSRRERRPIAVEVAPITRDSITQRRVYSGSLEATYALTVSPRIGGRIARVHVDLGDTVKRGQVVAELDDDEQRQEVAQNRAELAVVEAKVAEAQSALDIAQREYDRVFALRKRGIASDTRLDEADAVLQAARAQKQMADAQVKQARAALQAARVRLRYTSVSAEWNEGDDERVVAERRVDEGETVSANEPLLSVVELDPILGAIFIPETDYPKLRVGQPVSVTTDAHPGVVFDAKVERIAPVFKAGSRQARVEIVLENDEQLLRPGAFIRAEVVLGQVEDATIVPRAALTTRAEKTGVFLWNKDTGTVSWREVQVGIGEEERVQVFPKDLTGSVVTLGQQLIDDGSKVSVEAAAQKKHDKR